MFEDLTRTRLGRTVGTQSSLPLAATKIGRRKAMRPWDGPWVCLRTTVKECSSRVLDSMDVVRLSSPNARDTLRTGKGDRSQILGNFPKGKRLAIDSDRCDNFTWGAWGALPLWTFGGGASYAMIAAENGGGGGSGIRTSRAFREFQFRALVVI
jgi:hypothetical protein